MSKSFGLAGLCLCLALLAPPAEGEVFMVPSVDYPEIQDAVDAAVAGDVIQVASGTFSDPTHEAGAGDTTKCCVVMKSGITLRGAGIDQTIIDVNSLGRGIHMYQVSDVEICHLTIREADAEVKGTAINGKHAEVYIHHVKAIENSGGGMAFSDTSDVAIEHCIMEANEGKAGAGIDVLATCTGYLYDCQILDNEGPSTGGILLRSGVTLDHCLIDGNVATGTSGVVGGGIGVFGGSPQFLGCQITHNSSGGSGGGIYFTGDATSALVENCLIADNDCAGDEGRGGGVFIDSYASPTFRSSIITGNSAVGPWANGGGIYVGYGNIDMQNCTIYDNWTDTEAGFGEAGNVGIQPSAPPFTNTIAIAHTIISHSSNGAGVWGTGASGFEQYIDISCCDVYGNAGGDAIIGVGTDDFTLDPLLCDPGNGNFHIEEASPCAPGNHPGGAGTCGDALIGAKTAGCTSSVSDPAGAGRAMLIGNQPNPFDHGTVISFALAHAEEVDLEVFDLTGRRVTALQQGPLGAGVHHVAWDGRRSDGRPADAGIYFYRLRAGGVTEGMRMMRLR